MNKGLIIGNILLFMHFNMNGYAFYATDGAVSNIKICAANGAVFDPHTTEAGKYHSPRLHDDAMSLTVLKQARRNQQYGL